MTYPRGSCFAKIRASCQTFKIDIERSFFTPSFLTILKPLERSEIIFSHQKSVKKAFFHTTTHQETLLLFYLYMFSPSCFIFK